MSQVITQPTALDDFFSPEFFKNPYPVYERLREEDPVHWNPLLNAWMLSRYDDLIKAYQSSSFSNDWPSVWRFAIPLEEEDQARVARCLQFYGRWLQAADQPKHTRLRGLAHKAFTPRTIERLQNRIQQFVDEMLLQAARMDGRMEIMRDLAMPLPVAVITELLGIPNTDREQFKTWTETTLAFGTYTHPTSEQLKEVEDSILALTDYMKEIINERRKKPQEDLITALTQAEEQGSFLSEEELIANCVLLLIAGHETTTNLIGNGLLALLRNPDQLWYLRHNPALIKPAIEELLRYDSPVQWTPRMLAEDLELGGKEMKKGQFIWLGMGSANHDPSQFKNPDQLNIARDGGRHVSFGYGIHYCLGAALARMEGQIAFSTLLNRFPALALETEEADWRPFFHIRGLKSLPVTF
jgi:cytochrome P450